MPSFRRSFTALFWGVSVLLGWAAMPGLADTKVTIKNESSHKWTLRVVDDGSTVGGSIDLEQVVGYIPGSDSYVLNPHKAIELTYKYALSYQVRFQLLDQNGDWAEYRASGAALSRSERYTLLYDSIEDPTGDKVKTVLAMDSPKNGDIAIKGDLLLPGHAPLPCPVAPPNALKPKGPFLSGYWFNPTASDFTVAATKTMKNFKGEVVAPPKTGQVVFTDLEGRELGRLAYGSYVPFKIPARTMVRVLYVPDQTGPCNFRMTLADSQGKKFIIDANHGKIDAQGMAQATAKASEAANAIGPLGFLSLIQYPDRGDLTFAADKFPFD